MPDPRWRRQAPDGGQDRRGAAPDHGLELSITGETADAPYRVEHVRMDVTLDADLDDDGKRKLIDIARNGCAVSNTLQRGAAMDIELGS